MNIEHIRSGLLDDYEAIYGPRKTWSKKVINFYYHQLGALIDGEFTLAQENRLKTKG